MPRKHQLPTEFKVFSTTWKIKWVKRLASGDVGVCDYKNNEIRILSSLSHEMAFRTLCHELVHAAGLGEQSSECSEVLAGILISNQSSTSMMWKPDGSGE